MKGFKYSGCGNRFILIDGLDRDQDSFKENVVKSAQAICENSRYNPDGILFLEKSKGADVFMNIINSDGSIAKMCGNGVRCVAQYLNSKNPHKQSYKIDTLSGIKQVDILRKDGDICSSCAEIGKGKVKESNKYFDFLQQNLPFDCVNVGNSHAVFYPNEQVLRKKERIYQLLQSGNGINVEFLCEIRDNNVKVRVFERGCGETLACGTGATAVAFSLFSKGMGNDFNILMPGGNLKVKIKNGTAYLTGPTLNEGQEEIYFKDIDNYNYRE